MSDTDSTVVADVDEILEHIINANMLSMPYDVYSELFDAVDGLGVEIEKLESENARLREQLDYEHQTSRSRLEAIDLLKVENARLRELGIEVN